MYPRTTWRWALALTLISVVACQFPTRPADPASRVAVSPKVLTLQQYQVADFTAVGLTSTGDTAAVAVRWSATSGAIIDTSTTGARHQGRYKAGSDTGKVKVVVKGGGSADTAVVTVTPAPVAIVVMSSAAVSVVAGQTVQLTATPEDAGGNPLSGRVVTWASTNPGAASINSSGLVSGVAAGAATVSATSEGQSGTVAVAVTAAPVASVTVSPASASVSVGQTQQLTATPRDANGIPLTGRTVTWATSNAAVATVSGGGVVTGAGGGTATIVASSEGQTGTSAITVTAPVASVTVSPAAASLLVGQTAQLTATLKDANGTPLSGRAVAWASSAPAVATVSANGLVAAIAAGAATLTATSEGQSGTATVTVSVVPVAAVTVSPAAATIRIGATVQLSATPRDSAGNPLAGRVGTWASSAPAVATISANGLVTGVAAGTATLTATCEGQSGTATVTVTLVPVASVTVSPASNSLVVGQTAQLTVTTKDSAGNVLTSRTITWATSSATVATVSTAGLVTAKAAGSATITATSEGKSGTATVAVSPVPVASVIVSPASNSLVVGQTAQLTVTTKDSAGNVLTGRTITWATSSATVATVSTAGLVTAKAAGSATITATSEGKSGTATATVTAVPVASVSVSPASASVATGQTVQLTATPKDASGTVLAGRVVTWATSNAAVATVSASGLVSGVVAGSATITATSEGISGSSALTVTAPATGCATACHYVDVNGNDGNAGTRTAPWQTIQHAADVTNPGDTVIVNDGVYTGGANVVTIGRSGTATAWLVFRAANRWGAVVDGQNNSSTTGFEINGNYIRVEGFEVRYTSRYAMETYGGREDIAGNHDVVLSQNHLHDVGHICTGTTGGIVGVSAYSDNLLIERNVIHDIGRLGPGEQGCVEPNANWQNHDHGIYNGVGNNVVVRNNVFYNFTHGWAIQRYNGAGSITTGLTIVNNTFGFPNPNRDAQIIIATTTNNLVIANNVFYLPTTAGVWFDGFGDGATVVGNISTNAVQTGGTALLTSGNIENTDPLFVNATGFDFHLSAGSPARGLGVTTWCPAIDFDGVARTGACSAGAFQN